MAPRKGTGQGTLERGEGGIFFIKEFQEGQVDVDEKRAGEARGEGGGGTRLASSLMNCNPISSRFFFSSRSCSFSTSRLAAALLTESRLRLRLLRRLSSPLRRRSEAARASRSGVRDLRPARATNQCKNHFPNPGRWKVRGAGGQ